MIPRELELYLWDMRAQVEAQLRSLTKMHRRLAEWPAMDEDARTSFKAEIARDLGEVIGFTTSVRAVGEQTMAAMAKVAVR